MAAQINTTILKQPDKKPKKKNAQVIVISTSTVGAVFFVLAVLVAIGMFISKRSLQNNISSIDQEIVKYQNALLFDEVERVARADKQIDAVNSLLKNHTYVSPVFDLLESVTLNQVRYSSFVYLPPTGTITLNAKASNSRAFSEQIATMKKSGLFSDVSFSGVSIHPQDKSIIFSLSLRIEKDLASIYHKANNESFEMPKDELQIKSDNSSSSNQL